MGSTSKQKELSDEQRRQELALLKRVLEGDQKAWSEFCRRYENLVVGCVLRVLRRYGANFTQADLADLVSDVWVVLLRDDCRKLRAYQADRGYRVSSWIGLITTNCTIDQLRVRQADHSYLEEISCPERILVDYRRPDAAIELRQSAEIAREALSRLSEEEQSFVFSCYHEERSPIELAHELGITVNTVYSRKFKVRQKLARIVTDLTGCTSFNTEGSFTEAVAAA